MQTMKNVSFTSPYDQEAEAIRRRQMLAMQLEQQSQAELPAGQMAGGYYVATSPLKYLAQALKGAQARTDIARGDTELRELSERAANERSGALSAALRTMQGTPASSEQIVDEQAAGGMGAPATINAPAVPGNMQAGIQQLAGSRDPMLQQIGLQQVLAQMQREQAEPQRVDLGDKIGLMKNGQIVGYLPKGVTPDASFKEQGLDRRHGTVSANTAATVASSEARHDRPSGSAILSERGAMARHAAPSGSALVAERGAMARHNTPSGNALLGINPAVQGPLAEARAAGSERGQLAAKAAHDLPQAVSRAEQAIKNIDDLIGDAGRPVQGQNARAPHPGFQSYVGATWTPGLRFIEGTATADFEKRLQQVTGSAFLQAFEALKGGGAITEMEGQKGTQAITRMHKAQSEAEFVIAARELQDVVRRGVETARVRASRGAPASAPAATVQPGAVLRFDERGNLIQ